MKNNRYAQTRHVVARELASPPNNLLEIFSLLILNIGWVVVVVYFIIYFNFLERRNHETREGNVPKHQCNIMMPIAEENYVKIFL